jgi:hypothetical protein
VLRTLPAYQGVDTEEVGCVAVRSASGCCRLAMNNVSQEHMPSY